MSENANDVILRFTPFGGSPIEIQCDSNAIGFHRTRPKTERKTFCGTNVTVGNWVTEITFAGDYNNDSGRNVEVLEALAADDSVDGFAEYFPAGSGSGKRRFYASGALSDLDYDGEADDAITVEGTFAVDGNYGTDIIA